MSTYDDLIIDIQKVLEAKNYNGKIIKEGKIENNAFSITFPVTFGNENSQEDFYIKIPKIIFYDKTINFDTPLTEKDRILGRNEFFSLNTLEDRWPSLYGIEFVQPISFLENHNAIITRRIEGDFLFRKIRDLDKSISPFVKDLSNEKTLLSFKNFGNSLGVFHHSSSQKSQFDSSCYSSDLEKYYSFLTKEGVKRNFIEFMKQEISSIEINDNEVYKADCLKGIDIRQFFLQENDKIKIIDPGKLFTSYAETDLARFIVTYRILYWGTWGVFALKTPSSDLEKIFLESYQDHVSFSGKTLSLLIIKELLKQWIVVLESLNFRSWIGIFKFFYKKYYLNRFFMRLIHDEMERLKKT